jgi:hypothetical protein
MTMAVSSQNKAKRLMRNLTGASASVAVVTAVASMTVSVQGQFLNVSVFENKAFYQVEVVETITIEGSGSLAEDAEVPTQQPVRMRVQNQWDDFVISLLYGVNEGFIEPLRENQSYTLTIEMEASLGWRTLDTYTFNTRPRTNGVVSQLLETTTPLSDTTSFEASILTQDGPIVATNWFAELHYGTIRQQQPLEIGSNQIQWLNLPHQNAMASIDVYATVDGTEKVITNRQFETIPFVQADINLSFPNLTTLKVETTEDASYVGATYAIELSAIQSNITPTVYPLSASPLLIENLVQGELYSLNWTMSYLDEAGINRKLILLEKTIAPILTPIYVLGIYPGETSTRFDFTIDPRLNIDQMQLILTNQGQSTVLTFEQVTLNNDSYSMTASMNSRLSLGTTLELVLIQVAPYDYPITLRSIVYQGGETI